MAKLWTVVEGVMTRVYKDEEVKDLTINLVDLFPEFMDFDNAQKGCVVNGVKQKLSDTIARSKDMALTEAEKRTAQEALWLRNSVDRLWNLEKTGGKRETVSYKALLPAVRSFRDLGYNTEKTAGLLSLPLEVVEAVYNEEVK